MHSPRHHLRSTALALLAAVLVTLAAGCGGGGTTGTATGGATTLPVNDPMGYVPIPGAGAPNTTPIDPRLSSFCHQFYVFVLQVQAISTSLHAEDLAGAKQALGAADEALQRISGVAPDAIAPRVQALAGYVADDNATLQAQRSVASFGQAVGPLVGRIYQPYVDSYNWFVATCPPVLFAQGQQSTATTAAPRTSTGASPASG